MNPAKNPATDSEQDRSGAGERAAFLGERRLIDAPDDAATHADALRAWQESAFLGEATLAARLRHAGFSAAEFGGLIGGAPYTAAPEATGWADTLAAILAGDARPVRAGVTTRIYRHAFEDVLFEGLLRRFAGYYEDELLRRLAEPPAESVLHSLSENLVNELTAVSHRTLIVELHRARERGELGEAGAEPSAAGYAAYDERLRTDTGYLRALFADYPVLGRSLVRCGQHWLDYTVELLDRLRADLPELRATGLLPAEDAPLTGISAGLGDPHNGGRSVARLSFADGSRLIHKPRTIETERVYADAVDLLNSHRAAPGPRAMRYLARDGYGWCEFLEHDPCQDPAAVHRFYEHTGAVLAVLHFLGAIDIHMENVLAVGEHPIPIDLETILQPTAITNMSSEKANEKALDLLSQSVLATSMVPTRTLSDGINPGLDLSAISGGAAQRAPKEIPALVDPFTDRMRVAPVTVEIGQARNRPFLRDGAPVQPGDHADAIVTGFQDAYDTIVAHRAEFADLLRAAADIEIRYLVRHTRRYDLFRYESHHPKYLHDALDTERLLDKLWTAADSRPELAPVVESEKDQLRRDDIPIFHTKPGSTSLYCGQNVVAEGFFDESSGAMLAEKLAMFGREHRAVQLSILDDSLSTLPRSKGNGTAAEAPEHDLSDDVLLATARSAIDDLADAALLGKQDATWIGISIDGIRDETLDYKPMNTALYAGLAGMSLLFGYAARAFGSDRYADLARRSIHPALENVRDAVSNGSPQRAGAFNGLAGVAYALDHLHTAIGDEQYLGELAELVPALLDCARTEESPDMIAGLAGCAVIATDLHQRHGLPGLGEVVAVCAERLAGSAVPVGETLGWRPAPDDPPLGGFSHGTGGIGWAMLKAGRAFGEPAMTELGERALRYDAGLLVPGENAWQDLRTFADKLGIKQRHPTLWCHGATGIGLSRLLAHREHPAGGYLAEADVARRAVQEAGSLGNQCLCHGDAGTLEFLTLGAEVFAAAGQPAEDWRAARELTARRLLGALRTNGFRFGNVSGRNVPGLMIGKAGLSLALLRLVDEVHAPSVLWLQPAGNGRTA